MDFDSPNPSPDTTPEQEQRKGVALVAVGAISLLLHWVVPVLAPVALVAYAIYQVTRQDWPEAGIAAGLAALVWLLSPLVAGVMWLVGFGLLFYGVYVLVQTLRTVP